MITTEMIPQEQLKNEDKNEKEKKKREELYLPKVHYIQVDDWMDKIGAQSYGLWHKLFTHVDRSDKDRTEDRIPYPVKDVLPEKIGVHYTTLIRQLKPLWNYALIDLVVYDKGTPSKNPINVIVYECPFGKEEYRFKKLPDKPFRDYDKEYQSPSKTAGKRGGRPKNRMVAEMQPLRVAEMQPLRVAEMKPINNQMNFNISNNNKYTNLSIREAEIENMNIPTAIKVVMKNKIDRLNYFHIDLIDIENLFKTYGQQINEDDFSIVLGNVLDAKKYNRGFKPYMKASIEKKIKELAKSIQEEPIRKENLPDWFEENPYKNSTEEEFTEDPEVQEDILKLETAAYTKETEKTADAPINETITDYIKRHSTKVQAVLKIVQDKTESQNFNVNFVKAFNRMFPRIQEIAAYKRNLTIDLMAEILIDILNDMDSGAVNEHKLLPVLERRMNDPEYLKRREEVIWMLSKVRAESIQHVM